MALALVGVLVGCTVAAEAPPEDPLVPGELGATARLEQARRQSVFTCKYDDTSSVEPDDGPSELTIGPAQLAALTSGSEQAIGRAAARVRSILATGHALFLAEDDGRVQWSVASHLASSRIVIDDATRAALADGDEVAGERLLEEGAASGDPATIVRALARSPFASGEAAALHALGQLLVERGDVGAAIFALEDAQFLEGGPEPPELEATRALQESIGAELGDAITDVGRFGDALLTIVQVPRPVASRGFPPRHFMLFGRVRGKVGWSFDDFPQDSDVVRLFALGDTLVALAETWGWHSTAEIGPRGDPSWLLGFDAKGTPLWRTALPSRGPCNRDRVCIAGSGRLFFAGADQAFAVEARTGQIVWSRIRTTAEHPIRFVGHIGAPCPARHCPVSVSLEGERLEISCAGRVEVLDARTGALISDNAGPLQKD